MTPLPPPLIALTPGDLGPEGLGRFLARVDDAVAAGLRGILLREPASEDAFTLRLARELRARLDPASGGWLGVHDRLHVALAAGADAVHAGFRSLAPAVLRGILDARGASLAVGLSTHGGDDPATWSEADYLFHGPVRETASKAGVPDPPRITGFDGLAEAVRAADRPVWAIGGLAPADAADLRRAGARGAAVLSGVFGARADGGPGEASRAWCDALEALEAREPGESRERAE